MQFKNITFKNSSVSYPVSKVNVIVGPNNSGKTELLRDLMRCAYSENATTTVISSARVSPITDFSKDLLSNVTFGQQKNAHQKGKLVLGLNPNLVSGNEFLLDVEHYEKSKNLSINSYPSELKAMQVAFLESEHRLQIVGQTDSHNPQIDPPENLLQCLFVDRTGAEKALSELMLETFGVQIRLDFSSMRTLCLRIGDFNSIDVDPRTTFEQMREKPLLHTEGHGIKSFASTAMSILLCENRILLIDEPEEFLHPTYQRKLGRWIAEQSSKISGQIFIATHSSSVLSGLLSASSDVTVFRIQRNINGTAGIEINKENIQALSTSPLLSSQRVAEALFHSGVVICEADSDRVVYQAVAEKFSIASDKLFLFAHNKQTLKTVAGLFKAVSLPVAAIADIDLINEKSVLSDLVSAMDPAFDQREITLLRDSLASVVEGKRDAELYVDLVQDIQDLAIECSNGEVKDLGKLRKSLERLSKKSANWSGVKKNGATFFKDQDRIDCLRLLNILDSIGIFVVPVGELESWMPLAIRKQNWVPEALKLIADDQCPENLKDFISKTTAFLGGAQKPFLEQASLPAKTRAKTVRPGLPPAYLS